MRPEGDNTGSGIKKQLGKPTQLGEYEVLIREAVQNSWDARLSDLGVKFRVELRTLGENSVEWSRVLKDDNLPEEQAAVLNTLGPETVILVISDRGTTGLGGPIRSDRVNTTDEIANFVQFMRNVGEARDSELGGGTYGYGKGIFYRISKASMILVDSQNNGAGDTQRRLMGAALGEAFNSPDGRRFTGRHWWGVVNDGIPDPLLNEEAQQLATSLGLPGFERNETGTDIIVLAPDLTLEDESETLLSLATRIRSHVYWHLWPKFMTPQRPRGIDFSISVNGTELEIPKISSVPVIRNFARALDNIAKREGIDYELKKYRPNSLGEFAVDYVVSAASHTLNDNIRSILDHAVIHPPYRHVARMRQAELVVDYVPTAPMQTTDVGYVGVFRASAFADEAFAESEPPTHDVWATAGLTGTNLGIVRGAKGFIESETNALVAAKSGARSRLVQGLGKVSSELGSYLAPTALVGNEDSREAGQTARASRSTKTFIDLGQSPLRLVDGRACVEHCVQVMANEDVHIRAVAYVLLANGAREDPNNRPSGAQTPSFRGWYRVDDEELISSEPKISLLDLRTGEIAARFDFLPDTAVKTIVEIVHV